MLEKILVIFPGETPVAGISQAFQNHQEASSLRRYPMKYFSGQAGAYNLKQTNKKNKSVFCIVNPIHARELNLNIPIRLVVYKATKGTPSGEAAQDTT